MANMYGIGMVCYVSTWNLFVFYFVLVSPFKRKHGPLSSITNKRQKTRWRNRDKQSHGSEAMILDEEFRRGETLESDACANKKLEKM